MTFLVAFMYILSLITIYLILVDAGQFGSFKARNAIKTVLQTQNWINLQPNSFQKSTTYYML